MKLRSVVPGTEPVVRHDCLKAGCAKSLDGKPVPRGLAFDPAGNVLRDGRLWLTAKDATLLVEGDS